MLREMPTAAMREQWKAVCLLYRDRLKPNRKSGQALVEYLQSRYELAPFHDERADAVITGNVLGNKPFYEKLPAGMDPRPVTFYCNRNGRKVFIGVDLASGMYHVEDDAELWDELCAFQGLDAYDLKNIFCVYTYITCLKKLGMLESVLQEGS